MSEARADLRTRLRHEDEAAATLRSACIAAFNGQDAGGRPVTARAWDGAARPSAWIRFETGAGAIHAAPLVVGGGVARIDRPEGPADALAAAASLVEIEPLVALVEEAFALPLHPGSLDSGPTGDAVVIDLATRGEDGGFIQRLLLGIPADLAHHPVPPRPVALPPGLRLPWRATLAGPALTVEEAGSLAIGDMLLLGTFVSAAQLFLPGRGGAAHASIDLSQRVIRIDGLDHEGGSMLDETETASAPAADDGVPAPAIRANATLATTIELPGGTIRASELATLAPGSLLPIRAEGGALTVRVSVDGQPIADGELVALGEGYAVIVSALPNPHKH